MNRFKILVLIALCLNFIQITLSWADELNQTAQPVSSSEIIQAKEPENAEKPLKGYIGINGGVFIPNNDGSNSQLGLKNFRNGYDVGLIVGTRFNKYFSLETNIDVYGADTKNAIQSGNSSLTSSVTIISTSISAIAILPLDNFDVFAGIGGGYYHNYTKDTSTTSGISTTSSSNSACFGYQLLSGVDIKISKRFAVRVEYKHISDDPEFTVTGNTKRSINFGGSIVNGGILFKY